VAREIYAGRFVVGKSAARVVILAEKARRERLPRRADFR
jgi:hypothetical protein